MARAARTYRERTGEVARPGSWWKGVKKRARGIIEAPEKLSSRELAERATGVLGAGVLKPHAAGRLIIKGGKLIGPPGERYGQREAAEEAKGIWPWVKTTLQAPQKELSRVREIVPRRGGTYGTYYWPPERRMELSLASPKGTKAETVWHELVHGRQAAGLEGESRELIRMWDVLEGRAKRVGVSPQDFYHKLDPLEYQARSVAHAVTRNLKATGKISPKQYDEVYEYFLDRAVEEARSLAKLPGESLIRR